MPKDATQVNRGGIGGTFYANGSQERKTKSKKDKGMLMKARSPYMFFTMEWRGKFKKQNPNAEFGLLTRLMGAKWKELSCAEKARYVEQHERDKERVAAEEQAHKKARMSHSHGQGAPRAIDV